MFIGAVRSEEPLLDSTFAPSLSSSKVIAKIVVETRQHIADF